MSYKLHLNEGESYVEGRSPETAQALMESAEAAGLSTSAVKTTSFGYIVPTEILKGSGVEEKATSDVTSETLDHPSDPAGDDQGNEFDPADHSVEEVKAYVEDATEEERQRVLDAERNGKARKTLLADSEGDEN